MTFDFDIFSHSSFPFFSFLACTKGFKYPTTFQCDSKMFLVVACLLVCSGSLFCWKLQSNTLKIWPRIIFKLSLIWGLIYRWINDGPVPETTFAHALQPWTFADITQQSCMLECKCQTQLVQTLNGLSPCQLTTSKSVWCLIEPM